MQELYNTQQQMQAELAQERAARLALETGQQATATSSDALMRALLESLSLRTQPNPDESGSAPKSWKPPSWDGRAETFRDYLLRIKSSYRVYAIVKLKLSDDYY